MTGTRVRMSYQFVVTAATLMGIGLCLGCSAHVDQRDLPPLPSKPKVLIIGDSISMQHGYFPGITKLLGDDFELVHNPNNGGDSGNVRAHLVEWVEAASPDIIHFNCGLHDLKSNRETGEPQQTLEAYEANLRFIAEWLTKSTKARLIFALTTPVNEEWHRKNKPFDRKREYVLSYNEVASTVMKDFAIPVNDLYTVINEAAPDTCLVKDGVHMNAKGNGLLAEQVAKTIRQTASATP